MSGSSPPLTNPDSSTALTLRMVNAMSDIAPERWDALARTGGTEGAEGRAYNPFISHRFLSILEESGSVGPDTGWQPCPLVLARGDTIIGVAPCYLKTHSYGEYVFDQHWADAYERAGGQYYPKLVIASPHTPVPGPRLLCANPHDLALFARALGEMTGKMGLSSAHVNFTTDEEQSSLTAAGFLGRIGEQFHWHNRGYASFDDFLAALSSRKRKAIRQERRKATSDGIYVCNIAGADITPAHWDALWGFYQDTGARKWGTPYLTRDAFSLLGTQMPDDLLLTLAYAPDDPAPIAGALHMIGSDALYGRYWGARREVKFLHFECCYYQAIDYAITHGLARVEAGAQGHHKLARGYEPVVTRSAHWICDPSFRTAISNYLDHERDATTQEIELLQNHTPFRNAQQEN